MSADTIADPSLLAPGAAAVVYEPGPRAIQCTFLTRGTRQTIAIPLARPAQALLKLQSAALEPAFLAVDPAEASQALAEIRIAAYAQLFAPVDALCRAAQIRTLAIIALGPLERVPFHLLIDAAGQPVRDRLDICYLPSLPTLTQAPQWHPPVTPLTILADPEENLAIARGIALSLQQAGAEILLGQAATQSALVQQLQQRARSWCAATPHRRDSD